MKVTTRQPVMVPAKVYNLLLEYRAATGIPIAQLVTRALTEWLNSEGAARALAALKKDK